MDKLNVKEHIDINMIESNNIKNVKIESFIDSKMKNINKNEISTTSKSKKKLNINTFHEDQNHTENSLFHIKNIHDTVNNIVSKNTMENKTKTDTNREENANNKEVNNFLIEIEMSKTVDKTNQHFAQSNENKNLSSLPANFVCNKDSVIKLENELQLIDNDENIYSPNTIIPLVSPIKLKQIQQKPKTKFSEDDVVNLSDSEDDIFPCSQLFDIGYGMNTSVKDEIKEEPAEIENVRYSIVDDADLVISLTDSEDEDNNWLHRLSRSQILNENDEIDINDIKKEDIKADIDIKKPFLNEFEFIDKRKNIDEQIEVKKSMDKEEKNISDQAIKNLNEIISPKTFLTVKNLNKIISQETLPNKTKNFEDIEKFTLERQSSKYQNSSPIQKKTENYIDIANRASRIENTVSSKKKKVIEKKVPEIEPPHLPIRKRNSNKVKQSPQKHEKSTKKKLSATEKKKREEMLKIEQRLYAKEQKNRKMLHKWADCLPPSKQKKVNILSKEEKKVLVDSRKMKLKKLAIEEKRLSLENNQEKKRIVSKPKAKVTTKTRNDFLVEDTISASKLENLTEKPKTSSSQSAMNNISNSEMTNSVKHKNISKEITKDLQYKLMLNDISNLGKIPKKSNTTKMQINTVEAETALKELSLEKKIEKTNELKNIESKNKSDKESSKLIENKSSVSKSNIKSNFMKPKKRVSFSAVIEIVREYQIDESNVLKKLTGKDAPIPAEKVAVKKPSNTTESNAKWNQFLWRILCWKPIWLEEQQYLNQDPPVIQPEELNVTLTHYKSYEEYYNIISPLLLLEIWHGITKQFQSIDHIYRRPTFMCSIVENSIQTYNVSNNIFFTTLMLEVLATKEDIKKQIHPIYGDLIFFEYVQNHEKSQKSKDFRKVFAYVTNVYTTVLTPVTRFNQDLKNYVKNPHTLLTYTVITKCLDKNILVNRVQRLRAVIYLRSSLRMVQALQFLPNSPLVNLILNPQLEMYKLPVVSESETLVTGDKLNQKQMEAVNRVTKAAVHKDTKLCFIQGPPGTGKSKVIVNIITQILYGNNRYTSNGSSFKMLVCAPSNTAIDEIVLRLLNVRTIIKQQAKMKPFKMVRIGQSEMMHPKVKDISVMELAKRDIRKTNNANNTPSDSIENEKLLLQSKINALRCELTNSRNLDEAYKQHIRMKLNDMTMKYELLKNRESLNELNIRNKEYMKLQRMTENKFLEYADIITCTLSSCYTSQMESIFGINKKKISVCIVDEATQSCEAETLIPLMLGINILILVGDPNQLPATVLSTQAKKYGLDQSIFSRVQNAFELQQNNPIIMLDTQYRMQHDISSWPNKFFYGGKLKTAIERDDTFPFYPYRILNLNSNQNDDNSNDEEADFVANIIYCMLTFANLDNWESYISCGILTPYNNQKSMILTKIHEK